MSDPRLIGKTLEAISGKAQRQVLDTRPHFIPLNLDVLNLTLGSVIVQNVKDVYDQEQIEQAQQVYGANWEQELAKDKVISLQELKAKIITHAETRHKNKIKIIDNSGNFTVNGKAGVAISEQTLPAVVYNSKNEVTGLLYNSFDGAYQGIFKDFLNKEISKFIKKTIYKDFNYKIGFDVGHILGTSDLATTPLAQKLKKILSTLSQITEGSLSIDGVDSSYLQTNSTDINKLKSAIDSVYSKLAEGSTYGPKIEAEIKKDFGLDNLLVSLNANIVIIQDRSENQGIYSRLLEGPLNRELVVLLKNAEFSNSMIDQVAENLARTIAGKKIKIGKSAVPIKIAVRNNTKKATLIKKSGPKLSVKNPVKYKRAPTTSNLTNLQNLLNLLNARLVDQVKKNMGNGTRRDVLNLQTGRFAESVEVTRLSESRQGMITAFYTYMKNPYATFSAGGRQEYPTSRDPKTLIAKSIREIAAEQISNRLRSVLV